MSNKKEEKVVEPVMALVGDRASKIRTEFVTSDQKQDIRKLCENYGAPIGTIEEIAKREKWVQERDAYQAGIMTDVRKQIEVLRTKAEMNTLSRSVVLQKKLFDKMLADIDSGLYHPTMKDFVEISKIISKTGDETNVGVVGNNNKVLNITMTKPLEEMSFEEIVKMEQTIIEQTADDAEEE
jgi:hypothetical protein